MHPHLLSYTKGYRPLGKTEREREREREKITNAARTQVRKNSLWLVKEGRVVPGLTFFFNASFPSMPPVAVSRLP